MFEEVIVIDVVSDLSYYTQEILRSMVPDIKEAQRLHFCDFPLDQDKNPIDENSSFYLRAPRNTILGIKVDDAKTSLPSFGEEGEEDKKEETGYLEVYYPFFSSHFSLPVKPGESVFVTTIGERKYWMSRVSQPLPAEDPNFTHRERRFEPVRQFPVTVTQGADEKAEIENQQTPLDSQPSFPIGPKFDQRDSNRLKNGEINQELSEEDDEAIKKKYQELTFDMLGPTSGVPSRSYYDKVFLENRQKHTIVYEPVPRITKRPGDLVLQGSNNSSIVLGTERAWDQSTRPDGTKTNAQPFEGGIPTGSQKGVVDIVAGRGRIDQEYESENILDKDPSGTTRPRVVKNTREAFETNKNPGLDVNIMSASPPNPDSGHLKDAAEGDPDFLHDASRVYVSMKSNPDILLFGNVIEDDPYPLAPDVGDSNDSGENPPLAEDTASIIVKSDEVRIVARYRDLNDPVTGSPKINGSIRLVKEGKTFPLERDGDGSAVIMMLPDGTIMIDGPKIVIGSGDHAEDDGHGSGQQLALGVGATEPMVLGNELKTKLEALIDEIKLITVPTPSGPSGVPNNGPAFDGIKTDLSCILSKLGKTL